MNNSLLGGVTMCQSGVSCGIDGGTSDQFPIQPNKNVVLGALGNQHDL